MAQGEQILSEILLSTMEPVSTGQGIITQNR